MNKKIKPMVEVLLVEPAKKPRVIEIENSLAAIRDIVGERVRMYYPFDDNVALVCNEEGKKLGLPCNRAIYNEMGELLDIIKGTFFVCYAPITSDKIYELPDFLLASYQRRFRIPQCFVISEQGIEVTPFFDEE